MNTIMQNKICLITGATNGIGKSAAEALARMGATVVIVGRDAQKTAQVAKQLRADSGNSNIDSFCADLSSAQAVRQLADEFNKKYSRLDVLINNAGAVFMQRELSVDGMEMTFALNHRAAFLLTHLLLDTLKASAPARIINISSNAHANGKIDFDNLQGELKYSPSAYDNSKLANILFTTELARRLEGSGVTVNALHPGLVSTGFGQNNPGLLMKVIGVIMPLIGRSPQKGAETTVYLASAPEVENISGKYFVDCKIKEPAPQATNSIVAEKLWNVSAEIINLKEL